MARRRGLTHRQRELKRAFEVGAVALTALLLVGLSRLETRLFELAEAVSQNQEFLTTIIYFGLINLNVILILLLFFLIFRNLVKLVVERRRGVLGSRLRSKLVLTLIFFAVAPTALLFYVSNQFITTSFDRWFSEKVRNTIQQTREAGAQVYNQDRRRLEGLARIALSRVQVEGAAEGEPFALAEIDAQRLEGFAEEYHFTGVVVYNQWAEAVWRSDAALQPTARQKVEERLELFRADPDKVSLSQVDAQGERDAVKGLAPIVDRATSTVVGLVETREVFGTRILASIEEILSEFADLRPSSQLVRLSYTILMVVMALLIVFSATWLGFYVAREITGPIQSLAEATREVALGNYDVTLESRTDDETGFLVRAFNRMTGDLRVHKQSAEEARQRLLQTNAELDRRRKYMEVVLENITAGVVAVSADGVVTTMNSAAQRLLQVSASAMVDKPIDHAPHHVYAELWSRVTGELEAHRASSHRQQLVLRRGEQELRLVVDITQFVDERGQLLGTVLVFDDATEQVKLQKVIAWREVARRIAHEIKNPITPIRLNAERLLRRFGRQLKGDDRQVFETCVQTILTQVDSLKDLVNEFSKFARLPSISPRATAIAPLVRDAIDLFQLSYPDKTFSTAGLEDLPPLALDRDQITRCFVNLIANALEAEGQGGKRATRIEIRGVVKSAPGVVRIEIADDGPGFAEDALAKVFEPYFSTKKGGTGLGLAIVSQIISEHGGYLRASNAPDGGAVVRIELPLADRAVG